MVLSFHPVSDSVMTLFAMNALKASASLITVFGYRVLG